MKTLKHFLFILLLSGTFIAKAQKPQPDSNKTVSLSTMKIRIRCGQVDYSKDKTPLYVIDGQPISDIKDQMINPEDILKIEVINSSENRKHYGEKARHGLIHITTKEGARKQYRELLSSVSIGYGLLIKKLENDKELLYVLNGVPITKAVTITLVDLKAQEIKHIKLLDPETTTTTYGLVKSAGAVEITTLDPDNFNLDNELLNSEKQTANKPSVYPLPFRDNLHVSLPDEWNKTEVRIFDKTGTLMLNTEIFSGESIDVSDLTKGLYIIQLKYLDEVKTLKVTKQ